MHDEIWDLANDSSMARRRINPILALLIAHCIASYALTAVRIFLMLPLILGSGLVEIARLGWWFAKSPIAVPADTASGAFDLFRGSTQFSFDRIAWTLVLFVAYAIVFAFAMAPWPGEPSQPVDGNAST